MNRILHVNLERGWRGGERQTLLLALGLRDLGLKASIMARAESPLMVRAMEEGVETIPVRRPFIVNAGVMQKYDLIHTHEVRSLQLAAFTKWWHRRPIVVTRRLAKAPSNRFLTRLKYRLADQVVAESQAVKKALGDIVVDGAVEVVNGAVSFRGDYDNSIADRLSNRFQGSRVVGCVAAFTKEKGHIFLLQTAELLQSRKLDVVFLLLGDGPLKESLIDEANKRGLKNVVFEGFVENVEPYFSLFDLVVISSKSEAFVSVALDAFAAGVPVVATNVGGNPEAIIPGVTGELVEYGDVDGLAERISGMLCGNFPIDSYKENAKRDVSTKYTVDNMARRYLSLYQSMLS